LTTLELVEKRSIITSQILDMEFKNTFIKAFLKITSSKDFKLYMQYKQRLVTASTLEEKTNLLNKLNKLESYGYVSDYFYLINNCESVTSYLDLKNELTLIDAKLAQMKEEEVNLVKTKKLVVNK